MKRPRMRRSEDVEKDLLTTKIKRWRKKALDREEWASVVMEARLSEVRKAKK
jgi:hypothetical protein